MSWLLYAVLGRPAYAAADAVAVLYDAVAVYPLLIAYGSNQPASTVSYQAVAPSAVPAVAPLRYGSLRTRSVSYAV